MSACEHMNFRADCDIGRLSAGEGGPITGYTVAVKVKCAECGLPFRFIGLNAGSHYSEPRVNIDGTELRAPIEPAEHQVFAARANFTMPPLKEQAQ